MAKAHFQTHSSWSWKLALPLLWQAALGRLPGPEHMGPNQLKSPTLPSANTLMASLRAGPWAELTSQLLRPKEPARDPHPSRLQLGHLSRAVCRPGTQRGIQIRGGLRLSWMPACPRAPSSSLLKATLSRRPALTSCH